jgi:hypothetical protein
MARRRVASVRPDKSSEGRQFTAEVILWAVRWYLMFPVSYRDLELMLAGHGVDVAHTTLFRWTQTYAPEIEKRIRPHLRLSNGSWRVDETYVRVKGCWMYGFVGPRPKAPGLAGPAAAGRLQAGGWAGILGWNACAAAPR